MVWSSKSPKVGPLFYFVFMHSLLCNTSAAIQLMFNNLKKSCNKISLKITLFYGIPVKVLQIVCNFFVLFVKDLTPMNDF